jgi:hypothetical protein
MMRSRLPMSTLIPLKRYKVVDDMVNTLLNRSCCTLIEADIRARLLFLASLDSKHSR